MWVMVYLYLVYLFSVYVVFSRRMYGDVGVGGWKQRPINPINLNLKYVDEFI